MQPQGFTRHSVKRGRQEMQRGRRTRRVEWALVAAACVVIVVFAALIASEGLG